MKKKDKKKKKKRGRSFPCPAAKPSRKSEDPHEFLQPILATSNGPFMEVDKHFAMILWSKLFQAQRGTEVAMTRGVAIVFLQ